MKGHKETLEWGWVMDMLIFLTVVTAAWVYSCQHLSNVYTLTCAVIECQLCFDTVFTEL